MSTVNDINKIESAISNLSVEVARARKLPPRASFNPSELDDTLSKLKLLDRQLHELVEGAMPDSE